MKEENIKIKYEQNSEIAYKQILDGLEKLKEFIRQNSCSIDEIERKFSKNPLLYKEYLSLTGEWKKRFQEYMAGIKTLPLTYDPFFKKMFSVDVHSDRLSDFISAILNEKVKVKCMLPNENRIVNEASLLIMDMLVELEDGSLVNVEIQKIPYTFPGQRISCYLSDTMTRQYAKVKAERGEGFIYKDLNKVITIVIYENSPIECRKPELNGTYIHKGKMKFDTGLEIELYQECYIIALDEFQKSLYHLDNKKRKTYEENNDRTNLNAWLSLLVTDNMEQMERNVMSYPWLEEIYEDMSEFLVKPEEVLSMYSEALKIIDENTVKYMIDELKEENTELKEKNVELKNKLIDFEKKQSEVEDLKLIEIIKKKLSKGKNISQIANELEETEDNIKRLIGKIGEE